MLRCTLIFASYIYLILYGVIPTYGLTQQSYVVENIDIQNGIPSNHVYFTQRDSSGNLWIGTKNGLIKYNGISFSPVEINQNQQEFSPKAVYQEILNISANEFYLAKATKGLTIYNSTNNTIQNKSVFSSLDNDKIKQVITSADSCIWIGTFQGIYQKKKDSDTLIHLFKNRSNNTIYEDSKGRIWVAFWRDGVRLFDKKTQKFKKYDVYGDVYRGRNYNTVNSIFEDSKGKMWFGSWGDGFFRADSIMDDTLMLTQYFPSKENRMACRIVQHITENKNGDLFFVGPEGFDVLSPHQNNYRINDLPEHIEKLRFNHYEHISIDKENIIWLSSTHQGVFKISNYYQPVTYVNTDLAVDGYVGNKVHCIYPFNTNSVLVGIQDIGYAIYSTNNKRLTHYKQLNPIIEPIHYLNCITSMHRDAKNNLWIGTRHNGLFVKLKDTKEIIETNTLGSIKEIQKDFYNNIWILTLNNLILCKINNNQIHLQHIIQKSNIKFIQGNEVLNDLHIDSQNNVLLATNDNGIYKLKDIDIRKKKWIFKTRENDSILATLPYSVNTIEEDKDGVIWLGTNGDGLIRWKQNKHAVRVTPSTSPNVKYVYAIETGDDENLWLSTEKGIAEYRFHDSIQNYRFYSAQKENTMYSFFPNSSYKIANNFYFGAFEGFYYFNPKEFTQNNFIPQTTLNRVKVNNKEIPNRIITNGTLYLSHQQRNISIELSNNSLKNPSKNSYAYMLKGYSDQWIHLNQNTSTINIQRLKPGKYNLWVKSSNNHQLWHEPTKILQIVLAQSKWLTWWAFVIYILIFAIIVAVVAFVFNFTTWLKQAEHFEKEEYEQSRSLFGQLTADFPTPEGLKDSDKELLVKLEELLTKNFHDPKFNVSELQNMMHMSKTSLFRKTTILTGMSSNELIRNYRLAVAHNLLLKKPDSISNVAFDCGFNDPSYFGQCFKNRYGQTPSDFLESL
ncbi:MAG: helix-turn-helix domain-containing protein [Bacteroidales bacterium]|nr:helix-turn-helix domain-containing protein [Bacteroidales bacterium]